MVIQNILFACGKIAQWTLKRINVFRQIYLTFVAIWAHMNLVLMFLKAVAIRKHFIAWATDIKYLMYCFVMCIQIAKLATDKLTLSTFEFAMHVDFASLSGFKRT